MKRKPLFYAIVMCAGIVCAGGLGYVEGYYVQGLQHTNDMVVQTYCDILRVQSLTITRLAANYQSDGCGILEPVLEHCASFLRSFEGPALTYHSEETQSKIRASLAAWDEAQKHLGNAKAKVGLQEH